MRLSSVIFALAVLSTPAAASQQGVPSPEAAALAQGWSLLAKGDAAGAANAASQQLVRDQFSSAALTLLVDAEMARGGASAGLSAYEKWLGARRLDNPHVLRRVARALLSQSLATTNPAARVEALKALAADGDAEASARLEQAATPKGVAEARALAALGNPRAVKLLIAQLTSFPGSKSILIEALGESGSPAAVPHLLPFLTDPNDRHRATAAEALGR